MKNGKLSILKKIAFFVVVFSIFFLVFVAGMNFGHKGTFSFSLGSIRISNINDAKANGVDFSVFWEAWNKMKEKSTANLNDKDMVSGAILGLLSSTGDPYTTYFTKEENKQFREDIGGEFYGIGIELIAKNGMPTVVAPLSDTPAEKAGLKPNDIISKVDGISTSDIGFNELINKIRGEAGTKVKLEILRDGSEELKVFEIERAKIVVKSVESETKTYEGKEISYIKIRQFGDDTLALFDQAAKNALKTKDKIVVIDLRNNPGGYLETAIQISSYFIPDGVIVSEEGKNVAKKDYRSEGNSTLKDCKVVILINGGSASASEITAGALKDRKSIKLVGEKTFGKGSVQELIDLSDGSAVKITVAKWLTPNGTEINGKGIEADIKISNDEDLSVDEQLHEALKTASQL
jgi:carboxyl-terminal processing protease